AVLAACVVWVLQSDDVFQDAAVEAAERKAKRPSNRAPQYKARGTAWNLTAAGRPEMAFVWKAALQTLRVVDRRTLARMGAILMFLTVAASAMRGRSNGLAAVLGIFSLVAAGFTIL